MLFVAFMAVLVSFVRYNLTATLIIILYLEETS